MASLQAQLDTITANTRALVQPERLAITDAAVEQLLSSGAEQRMLAVGAQAPRFDLVGAAPSALPTMPDLTAAPGRVVHSTDLLAVGPLVVSFFRGRWCPYCMTELEAWQAAYGAVRERGALLVAISPQLPRQNDFAVQQHGITFPVLSDPGCRIAEGFGVAYEISAAMRAHYRSILINIPFIHGEQRGSEGEEATWRLPLPATFVLAQTGEVVFAEASADHRVRPDPGDVLAALDRLRAG